MSHSDNSDELGEILDNLIMEDYLDAHGIKYKRTHGHSGTQLNLKECPRCGGTKWKVYLNEDTGLGNCFHGSCSGEPGFNKFSYIKHYMGASNAETISHIKSFIQECGWRPKRKIAVATQKSEGFDLPLCFKLPIEGKNLKYLTKRGITSEMTEYFDLRFCEFGWFDYEFDGEPKKQWYNNRVIIPIYDLEGNMVTFQGRDITGDAEKKYLFPPGLAGTAAYLFNGQNVHNCKHIIIGEGVFDVMAIKAAIDTSIELRDVIPVGSFGKHLTIGSGKDQLTQLLELKRRGVEAITIMWDGELAAIIPAIDAALELLKYGFTMRVALLPWEHDPNEVPAQVVVEAFYKARDIRNVTDALTLKFEVRAAWNKYKNQKKTIVQPSQS